MNLNARFVLWIRRVFKKWGKLIVTVAAIWILIIMINNYLAGNKTTKELEKSYDADNPIMSDYGTVPKKYLETIKTTIDDYFKSCKAKDYEKAYNMLTDNCKKALYSNDIDEFKEYVDALFTSDSLTYYLQNYSNYNDTYIYQISISEDIEATGTTTGYDSYVEKISLIKDENSDTFKIGNNNYITTKDLNKIIEDPNMKIKVGSVDILYNKEIYNVTITNRTNNYIMLADLSAENEITLTRGNSYTKAINLANNNFYLAPGETSTFNIWFRKYFDQDDESTEISFNTVRLIEPGRINELNEKTSSQIASEVYSVNVDISE